MVEFTERPSHLGPDGEPIPLEEHLDDVRERVDWLVSDDAETPEGNSLPELAETVAQAHDFGKLTAWFQEHLLSDGNADPDGPKHHAPISALLAHYALEARGFDGADPLVGFLAVARHHGRLPDSADYVQRAAIEQSGRIRTLYRTEALEQATHVDETVPELARVLVERATDSAGDWETFHERLSREEASIELPWVAEAACSGRRLRPAPEKLPEGFYESVLQVWSALVFADKASAASLTTRMAIGRDAYRSTPPRRQAIDERVTTLQAENAESDLDPRTEQMNERREDARREVGARAAEFVDDERRVATLTLPTGMGKTLTGLDAALTVLENRGRDEPSDEGRLVYALPYTSIIDQVAAESRELFETGERNERVTVDHHLADTLVSPPDDADDPEEVPDDAVDPEEVPDDAVENVASLLGESWRSGLVVTTFVQLFESLAGPTNSRSMKLPALYGSVVVLDEPQALPLEWWPLVDRLVDLLTEEYGASVIAMTATQPKLLTAGDREPFSLVADPDPYYAELDRLDFVLHPSATAMLPAEGGARNADADSESPGLSYDRASELVADRVDDGNSVLTICNTIDSARELATAVTDRTAPLNVNEAYADLLDSADRPTASVRPERTYRDVVRRRRDDEPLLIHLTTRHRPCDRRHLIRVATDLAEAGEPVLFLSTQLVEAGVDVSFDEVIRDFAPMDSLVQAAGRCNRSYDRSRGRVTVWRLEPPAGRETPPSSAVYGRGESLTKLTAQALATVYDGEPMPEPAVTRDAVETYFELLDRRDVGADEYVDYLEHAQAEQLGRLSLIDERPAADVVVTRTAEERETIEALREAHREHRWEDLDDLVESTADWQVSVPVYPGDDDTLEKLQACERLFPDADRLVLDGRPGRDDGYFDATDGVVIPDTSVEARLL
ncbi:CRISPR-associated endonuclease Cas3'' [Halolamina salifodinae]|uniref:CRISPR-associated endonuclease/helicase Cas3/CRISPR-associated endonuclease Cas3-HD n=1 Tax=Halolamina salifodinae TaxID=1202767 RepID=A0A8T4GZS0_9EURY|nr:CRISPR-associated endonuclease Cas3'' [Halolamina salifodinae]MBP1986608.1 CRISPR-associated endonuclease/helicase Cas3/CRISPR-associated endonuclease Cas3-HD [Halolamina salifodinae]